MLIPLQDKNMLLIMLRFTESVLLKMTLVSVLKKLIKTQMLSVLELERMQVTIRVKISVNHGLILRLSAAIAMGMFGQALVGLNTAYGQKMVGTAFDSLNKYAIIFL